ncbi:MAG: PhoX family phosphatase [Ramlibacter sp.]|nr:PhoX family phosphatase [Ramlibacter sp.]
MTQTDLPQQPDRRFVLQSGAAAVVALLASGCALPAAAGGPPPLGFTAVPPAADDTLRVPPEYEARVLYRWGEPTGLAGAVPPWRADGSASAADQAMQAGMHHDGMHFFPLGRDSRHGLLVLNHEYTDEGLLHPAGVARSLETTRKSQHAMGVSVIEVVLGPAGWEQVRPSRYARRIHGNTPMRISGPAAGAPAMRTAANPAGDQVLGTFANCAMGVTPWGTYLTCEENVHGYFGGPGRPGADHPRSLRRYGVGPGGQWIDWWRHDARFDVTQHPNEAHRFGWVVEIDPMDPTATPVKRTALGRKAQESATCTRTRDGRVAVYMGDDARFEYIYKFVSRDPVRPGGYAANRDLLDHGTLYVARFDEAGRGQWLELSVGRAGLEPAAGFASQADVLIDARSAADAVSATPMDRPEWIAVHPGTGDVYVTLTNNSQRGEPGKPPVDAANPRARNRYGHILRWREAGGDAAATQFEWDLFALAGDPAVPGAGTRYPAPGADAFGSPDGLHFDSGGLLWIQTDVSGPAMHHGDMTALGNNQMLCADPATGRIKRFLTGPRGCEVTGCVVTPDRRTLFVNIQHPGETRDDGGSQGHWPDGGHAPPRSATVVVRRRDGGVVGT